MLADAHAQAVDQRYQIRDIRVLVIEDDRKTASLMRLYLEHSGCRVTLVHTGSEGLAAARRQRPDMIILDVMLPELDGISLCRAVRRESDVPIIMLTAKTTEEDKLTGLAGGADDYVTKPFSPRELVARVEAVLRRSRREQWDLPLRVHDMVLDEATREVTAAGRPVHLTPTEFRLLATFMRAPRRVFSRAELLERALGEEAESLERTLDTHIMNLRRKLGPGIDGRPRILTVHGVGYRLCE